MSFYEPHRRGAHAEAVAMAWLIAHGYCVFPNICGRGPIDLVAIDTATPNVILIDVKAKIYHANKQRRKPFLSDAQRRLGVRLLTVDLEGGVCFFEENPDYETEDAEQETEYYDDY